MWSFTNLKRYHRHHHPHHQKERQVKFMRKFKIFTNISCVSVNRIYKRRRQKKCRWSSQRPQLRFLGGFVVHIELKISSTFIICELVKNLFWCVIKKVINVNPHFFGEGKLQATHHSYISDRLIKVDPRLRRALKCR